MTLSAQPYKGTRDYYPEDKWVQNYIFNTWQTVVERFGYQEYGAPTLEPLDVYAAKSGQELVNEQTYAFTDRGGRTVAIRPEMTPTISRMVAAKRQELSYPARLYSIANFMRYERPQRGREREFWQLNVDIFGVDSIQADAEIITMAASIMKEFRAKNEDYVIRVNNRKLIHFIMAQYLGLDEAQAQQMVKLFDRKDKITEQDFNEQASVILESDEQLEKVQTLLGAQSIDQLPDDIASSQAAEELKTLFAQLQINGVDNTAIFDATLMRGLDYYTGTVFEVFDTHPENNRSLFGGGRYDGLVGLFGAEPISAVGMAPGGTMMENFLTVRNLIPEYTPSTQVSILVIDDAYDVANKVAKELRDSGVNVDIDFSGRKLDKQIKAADKKGIKNVIFIGPHDSDTSEYSFKQLGQEQEEKRTLRSIIDQLTR